MNRDLFLISNEVEEALKRRGPVVALESTLIAHGFPYPANYHLATELEGMLRREGVIPATVGILGGKIKVGLTDQDLKYLASAGNIPKASLRDVPVLLAKGMDGGTTVATTMQIAYGVGIKVFVTGGIGGVHRQAENTFDISADLGALAKFGVMVVCAGAKSVLDLPKTLEVLETLGVPVIGYRTSEFPAFYVRDSGLQVDYRMDKEEDIVRAFTIQEEMGSPKGMVIANPIPFEYEMDKAAFDSLLTSLLCELREKKVSGKYVTPYLLKRIHEETKGESVKANTELIKNNLLLGAKLAKAYWQGGV